MLRRLINGYQRYELELLAAIEGRVPAGDWQQVGNRTRHAFADLSQIERQQLSSLVRRYQGWQGVWFLIRLIAAASLIGLCIHLGWPQLFGLLEAIAIANAFALVTGMALLVGWVDYRRIMAYRSRRLVLLGILWAAGVLAGATGVLLLLGKSPSILFGLVGRVVLIGGTIGGLAYIGLTMLVSMLRNREYQALSEQLRAEAEHERLERQLSDSRLKLLLAQIEPHFLFNTLGAVQQLAEHGAPRAAALTADLIVFLRSSMTQLRADKVSLADDFKQAEAYLRVMQVRLGNRLRFELHLPETLASHQIPSMLLLTLVENAIKHGIEPALRGGAVIITASQQDACLILRVEDTGVGLKDKISESGVGLANIRERLHLVYDSRADLTLAAGEEAGAIATLSLPLHHTA